MALMLYLDDAMKVLLQNDFIDDGYIDDDGGSEIVRNELEQKCYLREPVDVVLCKDCKNVKWADPDDEVVFCRLQDRAYNWDFFCAYGKRQP
jgi:hypothetical protein